jgi:hypothetical protein
MTCLERVTTDRLAGRPRMPQIPVTAPVRVRDDDSIRTAQISASRRTVSGKRCTMRISNAA